MATIQIRLDAEQKGRLILMIAAEFDLLERMAKPRRRSLPEKSEK